MGGKKKKVLTARQKELLKDLGAQLERARDRAELTGPELGPRIGWAGHSSVSKVENGSDTDVSNVLAWADECDHEVLVIPRGSVQALASRLERAEQGERLIALALLELLADARLLGDDRAPPHFRAEIQEWRGRLERRRLLGAG